MLAIDVNVEDKRGDTINYYDKTSILDKQDRNSDRKNDNIVSEKYSYLKFDTFWRRSTPATIKHMKDSSYEDMNDNDLTGDVCIHYETLSEKKVHKDDS